jgi:hypothetical protein
VVNPLGGMKSPMTSKLAGQPPVGGGKASAAKGDAAPTKKAANAGPSNPMTGIADMVGSIVQMVTQTLGEVLKSGPLGMLLGGKKSAPPKGAAPQAAPPAAAQKPPAAGSAGNAQAAQGGGVNPGNAQAAAGGNGPLKVVQIDNFSADNTGFNHGQEMAKVLKSGGGDASLAGQVALDQYNVSGGNTNKKASDALRDVLARVQNGEQIDAVHMPLQAFEQDGDTQEVKQLAEQLSAAGVPVVLPAGNEGPGKQNALNGNNTFNVQSATNGQVNGDSGKGNVTSEGRTTSFASANLAPVLAAQKKSGQIA